MNEGTLVWFDTEPIASPRRKAWAKEDELAADLQPVKEGAGEQIAPLEAQKSAANEDSQALLERRLAEASRDYERRTCQLQEALDRCKAACERLAW
jgi:hypothetical protein